MIENNIFSSQVDGYRYTLTITSILGDILNTAEKLYGRRNHNKNILGIEFTEEEQPQIWFPYENAIVIQITENCINNMNKAIFQTAHEVIHCLCPKPDGSATYLEEGLATYFSVKYQLFGANDVNLWRPSESDYMFAYDMVRQLINYDESIILKLRNKEPDVSKISPILIKQICNNVPDELINYLTTNFKDKSICEPTTFQIP